MCNLYSMTRSHNEVARLFGVNRDRTGNRPPLPAIFPDQLAPVVRRDTDGARALDMMRWGFPPPPRSKEKQTTNVRRTESSWWRPWLKREFRGLVPATSFCEYTDATPKVPHWFALSADRPLFAFAGIWRPWTGVRGTKAERQTLVDETGSDSKEHLVFAFLTTEPNDVVRPIHAKAMPVILTGEACDLWLEGELEAALKAPGASAERPHVHCRHRQAPGCVAGWHGAHLMASNSGKVNREAGKPPRKKSPPELQKDDDASPPTRPAWQPAELCELRLPNGGTLTAIITGAETGRIAWHIDYRHGHTVQTIDGREEPSMEAARETAWEVMQIMCAALVEETGA